jgi:hypothetical protein
LKTLWFGIERFKNNQKPVLNSRTPNTLDRVVRDTPQTFSVNVTAPTGNPLMYAWKVNGVTVQTGPNSSYTACFMNAYNAPVSVTVVFSGPPALKDSTTWDFKLAGVIIVDGMKDAFFNALKGPDDGYLQIPSLAHNENGQPVNDADLSAQIWTAWDDQWFYLYEEVKDNTLSGNAPDVWNEDEIELNFDPQPTDSLVNSVWQTRLTALGMSTAGVVAADSLNSVHGNSKKQWVRKTILGGYVLELAVKWTAIQSGSETITPAVRNVFGLAINQHDNDGNGRHATIQWAAVLNNAVWNTPKYLGTVKLLSNNKLQYIPTNNMTGRSNLIPYEGYYFLLAPNKPVLSVPATWSTNQALNPILTWNTANRAASYTLQVSTPSGFNSTILNKSGIASTSQIVSGLKNKTKYYWRVSATNARGTSSWSDTWNFTTIPLKPYTPTLSSPANNSINPAVSLTLRWNASSRADSYALQVSTSSGFNSTFLNISGITSTSQNVSGMANNTKYYWRVMATNTGGNSRWSNTWNYTTKSNVGIDETGKN